MNKENKSPDDRFISEIPLAKIATNPSNPRQAPAGGTEFSELVASIKSKGVLVPIIVRPHKSGDCFYQIVAGERRFRAAQSAGLATIPACIRELTDSEAFDVMLIENLQRQDLTELEEAKTFKAYDVAHGAGAIQALSEKTGINPRYIRARIAALALPANILVAWEKGVLQYGHLEQLLRVQSRGEAELTRLFKMIKERDLSAHQLKKEIGEGCVPLTAAKFETAKMCGNCHSNSAVQQGLFGLGDAKERVTCFHPKCFKVNQLAWFTAHWSMAPLAKKYGTKSVRFSSDVPWTAQNALHFIGGPTTKCLQCLRFVSLITLDGRIERPWSEAQVCIGDKACFEAQRKAAQAQAVGEKRKDKAKTVATGAPRVAWHGEYFRNIFFRKRVPEILEGLKPEDPKLKALLVMCLAHTNSEAEAALAKSLDCKRDPFGPKRAIYSKLLALPAAKVPPIFREIIKAIFLEGQDVGDYDTFGAGFGSWKRRAVADFLGVNLAKEFAVTEEYLSKKTKNELVAFGKKSKLLTGTKARDYIAKTLKKKPDALDGLKKTELIKAFLKSGVGLVGHVPDEVLAKTK